MNHTRGLLDVRVRHDGQYGCIVYEIENVAETEKEARANAVLFSAAPDLLAALKDMLSQSGDLNAATGELDTAAGRAYRAVAKAEGR